MNEGIRGKLVNKDLQALQDADHNGVQGKPEPRARLVLKHDHLIFARLTPQLPLLRGLHLRSIDLLALAHLSQDAPSHQALPETQSSGKNHARSIPIPAWSLVLRGDLVQRSATYKESGSFPPFKTTIETIDPKKAPKHAYLNGAKREVGKPTEKPNSHEDVRLLQDKRKPFVQSLETDRCTSK